MFKIVVVGGPAEGYIFRCLASLKGQVVTDWSACVVLDPVGDRTYEQALSVKDDRIRVVLNNERNYALWNTCLAIDTLDPKDDDIIVSVDADDWLTGPKSLSVVDAFYRSHKKLLLTYGSWVGYPNPNVRTNTLFQYNREDFDNNIRKKSWRASHLKTFKYRLWKRINRTDFVDPRGGYFRVSWDLAFMWPMLEMAGYDRVSWIPHRIYTHNQETPFNDCKRNLREQMVFTNYIASMKPYGYQEKL